jgi:N-acetylglutamate synthase-like GNAT family acetyltransferase
MSASKPDAASLLKFHYECLQGMYFSEKIRLQHGTLLFSDKVTDPYYNFFAPDAPVSASEIQGLAPEFVSRGRRPAVYVTPLTSSESAPHGWKAWATDAWMVAEVDDNNSAPESGLTIVDIGISRRDDYISVFERAYSGDNPSDPYGQLDPGYTSTLSASFNHDLTDYRKYYVLAEISGQPVGVAALFTAGDLAGVYGVGTLFQHRNIGIGTAIMVHLMQLAHADHVSHIMLQTEAGSRVEHWYQQLGYETVFTAEYHIQEKDD